MVDLKDYLLIEGYINTLNELYELDYFKYKKFNDIDERLKEIMEHDISIAKEEVESFQSDIRNRREEISKSLGFPEANYSNTKAHNELILKKNKYERLKVKLKVYDKFLGDEMKDKINDWFFEKQIKTLFGN